MPKRRIMRILTVLFLPSSLIAAENGSPQPSQPAVDPANYVESAHKVVKKVKTPSRSQPTRKLGSSCTNLTI